MPNAILLREDQCLPLLDRELERKLDTFKGWDIVYPAPLKFNVIYYFLVRGEIPRKGPIINLLKTQLGEPYDLHYLSQYTDEDWFRIQADFAQRCVYRTQSYYMIDGHHPDDVKNFRAIPITSAEYDYIVEHVRKHKIGEEPVGEGAKT